MNLTKKELLFLSKLLTNYLLFLIKNKKESELLTEYEVEILDLQGKLAKELNQKFPKDTN